MVATPFAGSGGNLTGLCADLQSVTPSDSVDVNGGKAVFIICKGSAGDIAVITAAGNTVTYPIAAEEILPVGITRVLATGTTATTLWAFIP